MHGTKKKALISEIFAFLGLNLLLWREIVKFQKSLWKGLDDCLFLHVSA